MRSAASITAGLHDAPEAVAQHDVGAGRAAVSVRRPADRGHRVAVENERRTEVAQRRLDEPFERPVIGR